MPKPSSKTKARTTTKRAIARDGASTIPEAITLARRNGYKWNLQLVDDDGVVVHETNVGDTMMRNVATASPQLIRPFGAVLKQRQTAAA